MVYFSFNQTVHKTAMKAIGFTFGWHESALSCSTKVGIVFYPNQILISRAFLQYLFPLLISALIP